MNSSVSDIVGGLTKNTVQGGWGHSKEYWRYQKPSVEAMAHMFEAKFMKGERLEPFKKYFPTAYQKFEDAIKSSEGGGEIGSELPGYAVLYAVWRGRLTASHADARGAADGRVL